MSGPKAALTVALALTAHVALAQDDRAVPRGGGSSGGSGGRDHHAGARSSGDRGSSGASSSSSARSSSYQPTDAQRRHPRAGTGTGGRDRRYGSPYYLDPYRYSYYRPSYYGGWGRYYGYSPYYYSGYYGYSPYYYGSRYYGSRGYRAGALRVLVEPNEARVYVDGYYAGVADDFDGIFQRLHLAPGRHDISLRLDGYRTQNFKVYVPYDHTIKIHHTMVPGAPTDVSEETVGRPEDVADAGRYDDQYENDEDRLDEDELGRGNVRGEMGALRLNIRPTDASVYVDGAFKGTGRLRTLRLLPGQHRIEVVRPGYRTEERDVDVQPGREVEVELNLERN